MAIAYDDVAVESFQKKVDSIDQNTTMTVEQFEHIEKSPDALAEAVASGRVQAPGSCTMICFVADVIKGVPSRSAYLCLP